MSRATRIAMIRHLPWKVVEAYKSIFHDYFDLSTIHCDSDTFDNCCTCREYLPHLIHAADQVGLRILKRHDGRPMLSDEPHKSYGLWRSYDDR